MTGHAEVIDRVMHRDCGGGSEADHHEAVQGVSHACSAAAITIQPSPLVDTALPAPIQIGMVQAIGRIHGHRIDTRSVLDLHSVLRAPIVAQDVVMAAAELTPPLGGWVTLSIQRRQRRHAHDEILEDKLSQPEAAHEDGLIDEEQLRREEESLPGDL